MTTFTLSAAAHTAAVAAATKAGASIAGADAKRATLFAPLVDVLASLSGSSVAEAGTQWGKISAAFKEAYAAKRGGTDPQKAAANAWSRSVGEAGLKKPQTAEQARAAEKKKASRDASAVNPKGKPANPTDAKTAEKVGGAINIEANIQHIAGLLRRGDFLGAQTMIAEMSKAVQSASTVKAPAAPAAPKTAKTAKAKATAPEVAPF